MFIIFGWRSRNKATAEGVFHCPGEGGDRRYRRVLVRRWFTLFFIPVIPLNTLGEYIECGGCGRGYDERVLTMPTTAQMMDNLSDAMRHAVVSLIKADGVVDEAEKHAALAVMQEYSDTPYAAAELDEDLTTLSLAEMTHQMERLAPVLNGDGKETILHACLAIAAADGAIDESELVEVRKAGAALGMSPAHVRGIIAQAREALPAA